MLFCLSLFCVQQERVVIQSVKKTVPPGDGGGVVAIAGAFEMAFLA